jgi:chaperonin GroES
MKQYKPLDDRILIKPDPQSDTVGGLLVADENKPKKLTGTVVAVGSGTPLMNVKINITGDANVSELKELINLLITGRPMDLAIGDRVIYGQFAGTKIPLEDGDYLMVRRSDVFMIER